MGDPSYFYQQYIIKTPYSIPTPFDYCVDGHTPHPKINVLAILCLVFREFSHSTLVENYAPRNNN